MEIDYAHTFIFLCFIHTGYVMFVCCSFGAYNKPLESIRYPIELFLFFYFVLYLIRSSIYFLFKYFQDLATYKTFSCLLLFYLGRWTKGNVKKKKKTDNKKGNHLVVIPFSLWTMLPSIVEDVKCALFCQMFIFFLPI